MPRTRSYQKDVLANRAMRQFWQQGYYASSMEALVKATGVSRHGLYAEYGDKRGLFIAAIATYIETIVTPAFAQVEAEGAGLTDIRAYFLAQIALAELTGLPGPGCLMANTMVESGPHEPAFNILITGHLDRLRAGFQNALDGEYSRLPIAAAIDTQGLSELLTIASQGLWSVSRLVCEAGSLHRFVDQLLGPIEERFRT